MAHIQIETMRDLVAQLKTENDKREQYKLNIEVQIEKGKEELSKFKDECKRRIELENENVRLCKERDAIRGKCESLRHNKE